MEFVYLFSSDRIQLWICIYGVCVYIVYSVYSVYTRYNGNDNKKTTILSLMYWLARGRETRWNEKQIENSLLKLSITFYAIESLFIMPLNSIHVEVPKLETQYAPNHHFGQHRQTLSTYNINYIKINGIL